jgi:hypothetical protein
MRPNWIRCVQRDRRAHILDTCGFYPSRDALPGIRLRIRKVGKREPQIFREMDDMLARAACDFKDDTRHRQGIATNIENEVAITKCRRRTLAVAAHLPTALRELRP